MCPERSATKTCPACREEVKIQARVCRFCGYDFVTERMPVKVLLPQRTNAFAISSLVLGILWLGGLGSTLAVIFGYVARRQIDRSQGVEGGHGLATAGIVLGLLGVSLLVLALMLPRFR